MAQETDRILDLSAIPSRRFKVKPRSGDLYELRTPDELDLQTLINFQEQTKEIQAAISSGDTRRAADLDKILQEVLGKIWVGPGEEIEKLTRGEKLFLVKKVFTALGEEGDRQEAETKTGESSPSSVGSMVEPSNIGSASGLE